MAYRKLLLQGRVYKLESFVVAVALYIIKFVMYFVGSLVATINIPHGKWLESLKLCNI